jgi:methyltransferase family protein
MTSPADVVADAPALMIRPERVLLHALVRALRPSRVLEIGTHKGGSTRIMCAALDEIGDGAIVCVDPDPVIEPEDWALLAHRATVVVGGSPDALGQAAALAGGRFDFVLVDGNHGYDFVRRDIDGVLPFLAADAYLVFHDSHYWQVKTAIDDAVAEHGELVDCGDLSREHAREDRLESGNPVLWGGLRLLHFVGQASPLAGVTGRIRFRPELGFSSKPVVGPLVTGVKKLDLRLLAGVVDDLARQIDAAVTRLEAVLAAEMHARKTAAEHRAGLLRAASDQRQGLEREVRALSTRIAALEERAKRTS